MPLRRWSGLLLTLLVACGPAPRPEPSSPDEPQTAREKQRREAKANGELDEDDKKSWGKWRYQGDRSDCFYLFEGRCFKTKKSACGAARCKGATPKCVSDEGSPATLSCKAS